MLTQTEFTTAILESSRLYPFLGILPDWAHRVIGELVGRRYERYLRVHQARRGQG